MNYKILVNKDNPISKDYINNLNLICIKNCYNDDIYIEKNTYNHYLKLKNELEKININIDIESSYRSIEEQKQIREGFLKKYGEEYVSKYVSYEGYSEHHTALAIDIVLIKDNKIISDNEKLLKDEKTFSKIHSILKDYGFILRYPKDKENITGYSYEPWHIRYVTYSTANIIYNNNLTLEEYNDKYNINGILVVNKDKDVTSRDVVNKISNIFDTKKVGHTGTLDPLATGVLILTIGNATKISEDIMSMEKEYIAKVRVGIETDTLDITGNIVNQEKQFVPDNIIDILNSFKKTYMQEVPIYSAVKVNGKKLYEYARSGLDVELPKKEVTIKDIELLEKDDLTFTFRCVVSKGTYIRSLIRDIGKKINLYTTMESLIRTKEYKYSIEDSYTINDIINGKYKILSIEEVLNYNVFEIDDLLYKKISNGMSINNIYNVKDKVIFKYNNKIISIYKRDCNILKPYKKIN